MTRSTFAEELQSASDRIADVSRANLQVMLRRAGLMIRNTDGIDLDPRVDEALSGISAEMEISKADLIGTIIADWLVANAYLPVLYAIDDESVVDGNA
ncbi:hypothetical protein [Mesorhizobium ciceri]|uniref:Uncharacterized protein n=1 Tax=Mesorhizobium ciceri biovar biserrulae (strain HAMBI 2942 / LMG 23838 / WSM1271) TaxID=765698 RepID=E8T8V7_MESCW|nr:hypothetical protein [Mesorhizobium ciceri]ADV13005.1 hypothetical protein Mesci_3889 [Mesorhizobium ciceri biovar biserrulae WSM1271]